MGDQAGVEVGGSLYYVSLSEFERIKSAAVDEIHRAELFASFCRINTLYMIACAGSGHIGSSFSSIDIMSWLHLNELDDLTSLRSPSKNKNLFFSSKGHDAPALYCTLIGVGKLDFSLLHRLRRLGGLPGHPDIATPNIVTNTGSLGMGVSKAKGIIFADRLRGNSRNIYVLTGDGELQEGQFWESLISAANQKMDELIVIIDHNKLQSDTLVSKVSDLGDLEAKLKAFGWYVGRCDGNNLTEFSMELGRLKALKGRPKIIIANTIKGKGVSFMEHTSIDSDVENYKFHSGAPTSEMYVLAAEELIESANLLLGRSKLRHLSLEVVNRPSLPILQDKVQKLIPAYSDALLKHGRINNKIVALDADLILDTGLIPFKEEFSTRFIECGIAEQDMISQSGGMALQGLLPIAHSFSCFLSARSREQIYNNATENKKIIYVGSLAGLLPAGPGHSHQSFTDIATLAAIPNLVLVEPFHESVVEKILDWSISKNAPSVYLRISSVAFEIPEELPEIKLNPGCGTIIFSSDKHYVLCHGPWLFAECYSAVQRARAFGRDIGLIVISWLNNIDADWIGVTFQNINRVDIYQDHAPAGGIADLLIKAIALSKVSKPNPSFNIWSIDGVPPSGSNYEVMKYYAMDRDSIYNNLK